MDVLKHFKDLTLREVPEFKAMMAKTSRRLFAIVGRDRKAKEVFKLRRRCKARKGVIEELESELAECVQDRDNRTLDMMREKTALLLRVSG